MGRSWLHEVLVAFDQTINAVLGGYADETISARAYRLGLRDQCAGRWGRWRVMWVAVDVLFFWQAAHCERAYNSEQARLGLPPEYRSPNKQ